MHSEGPAGSFDCLVADGEASFAASVADTLEATREPVSAEAISAVDEAVARATENEVDAILVGDALDAPGEAIERLADGTDAPVVLLTDAATAEPIPTAVEAGVADVCPRVTADPQYELLVDRLTNGASEPSGTDADSDPDSSEGAYRAVFESVSDGLVVHDAETGEILDVNERFCEMNGYDREELVGQDIGIVTAPAEEYSYEAAHGKIETARQEGPQLFEWRNQRRDGETFPVEVHLSVVRIHGDQRVLASVRDISERKQREREYEQIFNGVNDSIVVHDPETGEMVDANETFCELLGYDRDTVLELGTAGVSVGEEGFTEERAREIIDQVMDGETKTLEWMVETNEGEHRRLDVTATAIEIGGEPRHVSLMRDVTERKRRERELRESERRLRLIAEHIDEIIYLASGDYSEILYINPAYEEIYGRPVEELYENPQSFVEAAHPEDRERYEADVQRLIEDVERGDPRDAYEGEYRIRRDGETRWVSVTRFPIENEDGTIDRIVGQVQDITERRRREREYEQIFDGVNESIVVQDPETAQPVDANQAFLDRLGYDDVAEIREAGFEALSATDAGYTRERARELCQRVVETGEPETVEWQQETREGERRWIEAEVDAATIRGEERVLSMQRDVTARKRREEMIRTLHESTDELHDADTPEAVCAATVRAAREVLNLSLPTCWLPEEESETLVPVAATDEAWEQSLGEDSLGEFDPGDFQYEVYEGDEMRVYDPGDIYEETPLDRAVLIGLGGHGILGAAEPGVEQFDDVTLDAARILANHATTALDRIERERELRESERRFRTIAERVDEIIYLANPDDGEVLYINDAYADIWGRPVEELYEDPMAFTDAIHPDDIEAFRTEREAMLADIRAGDPEDSYEFSYRIERPDGERRWIETTSYPILGDDDRPDRYVAIVEDVTEQHRREQTLETFHEATRELTEADSREAACQRAVRAAEDVLGFPLVSAFLYEDDTGRLEPTADTTRLEELDVDLPAFGPGESLPWQVYVEGESVTSSDAAVDIYGPGVSGPDVVLPLGSHGVMLVGAPTDDFDAEDVELAQILAATLEAALNHVADEETLAEREAELRRQEERATRLERLNAIIRDIEQATVEQSSRAGIEEAVCERLLDVAVHDLVWIAEPAVGEDELLPRASTGEKDAYMDALTVEIDAAASGHPAVAAYRQDAPQVVENVATDAATGEWRTTALRHGVQSVVSVPIRYETTTHGVLTVASGEPDAFEEATREVLAELGRSIGYAITVTEREQALESEGTTELEFSIDDDGLFVVRGSAEADCRIRLERTIRRTGGSFSMFYVVEEADPGGLVELANAAPSVETAQVVSDTEDAAGGLIEVTAPTWFGSVFTEHGAVVREATAEGGEGTLLVEAPRGADVRTLVEGFEERYPETELLAQRQRERTIRSLFELQDALQAELTDRQWEALETAYSAGYFGWPRETSGQEVAELIGVTQPTFNKHLRIAEQAAFRMLLDQEYPESEA